LGYVNPRDVEAAIRSNTKLVAITHASNVTGAIQPIEEITRVARTKMVLVDAAQTLGHVPINVNALDVDLLAASGHKGVLGPLGTGILYIRPGLESALSPTRQGGTGLNSTEDRQPRELPHRYEAGNLNTPALAGLGAALQFLGEHKIENVAAHEAQAVRRLYDGLRAIPAVKLYGPAADQPRAAVVSFSVEGYDPQDFAAALDGSFGIQCRAGLHCAPLMHKALGTDTLGGLVRFSPGWSTTSEEIDQAVEAVAAIASA
jgi:selenocysteine lyase/cysteine desulfurase